MTLPALDLQSECYSATGNLAAEGFRKLLGTPDLSLLQTLVREATQNCCDAAKYGIGPEIHFRLRRLSEPQLIVLRQNVFRDLPQPESSEKPLRDFLEKNSAWVLEICDFNTIGLAGPTRADRIPPGNEATDFIDFLRNVGSRRDTELGGGTYGYGKTSLYLSSRCSTILVDTQTTHLGQDVRRLLGCHLGSAHDLASEDGSAQRRTGRHWWGVLPPEEAVADPMEGHEAENLANAIGFLPRSPERRGTSVMILDPFFVEENGEAPETLMGMIGEALLWYFWPRMTKDTHDARRIRVHLEVDDQQFPLPGPEDFPPLDNFVHAIRKLRSESTSVNEICSKNPKKLLGRLEIRKGLKSARSRLVPENLSIFPQTSSHIAVMRPVELVVRYFRDDPLPDSRVEWAGVFVSDSDPEVESAFASAEPPAHDDWQPSILPKGRKRTFVTVALRRIKEAAREVAAPTSGIQGEGDSGPSLASVSGQFGRFLDAANGGGAGPGQKKSISSAAKKNNRISAPVFLRLEEGPDGERIAVFETSIHHDGKNPDIRAVARPRLVIDGGAAPEGDWTAAKPQVISWCKPDGVVVSKAAEVVLSGHEGDMEIHVSIPGDFAVTVRATLEDGGGNPI